MKRREFLALIGLGLLCPVTAGAQQRDVVRRIGVLMSVAPDDPEGKARFAAFQQGLQQLGWNDGHNVRIDLKTAKALDLAISAALLNRADEVIE